MKHIRTYHIVLNLIASTLIVLGMVLIFFRPDWANEWFNTLIKPFGTEVNRAK